jgi:sulfate transport system permease protein
VNAVQPTRIGLVPRASAWRTGRLALRAAFVAWVLLLVGLPLAAVVVRGLSQGPAGVLAAVTKPTALSALGLSVGLAAVVAAVDAVIGTAIAWALVRWAFPGRRTVAALVDLPFSVPTLVAGIVLVAFLGPQTWLGQGLEGVGLKVVHAWPGMLIALAFVTLPFVVRAVEPVLEELDPAEEEAARTLGAGEAVVVGRVLLPPLLPAIVTGAGQAFARAVGEFGAMAVVSGNIPHRTLTAPVHVLGEVEAGAVDDAAAVSVVLLALALGGQALATRLARRAVGGDA